MCFGSIGYIYNHIIYIYISLVSNGVKGKLKLETMDLPQKCRWFSCKCWLQPILGSLGGHVQGTCYLYDIVEHRITSYNYMVYLRSMCTAHAKFVVLDGKTKPDSPGEIKCLKHLKT